MIGQGTGQGTHHLLLADVQEDGQQEQGQQVLHRHGLLQHHLASSHCPQPAGEPGMVHPVHSLPG